MPEAADESECNATNYGEIAVNDKKLWEVDHAYYCNEGNFYANGCGAHFERWQDFMEAEGDADMDYNLLFRFDFVPPYEDDDSEKPIKWVADENYRDCTLKLFYMGRGKVRICSRPSIAAVQTSR